MPESRAQPNLLDSSKARFAISFIVRLVNAFLTLTFYQPDEYYQSWEVAYSDVYGVGFRSWEWQAGIRTSLVPRFMALLIKAAAWLHIDHLVLGKVVMALVASTIDIYTPLLAQRVLGPSSTTVRSVSRISWVLSLFSMFNWYCSTRPFSNTFETALVAVAMYHWYSNSMQQLFFAEVLAHVATALRPSNVIVWVLLGVDLIWRARTWRKRALIVLVTLAAALVTQGGIIALDFSYYQGTAIPYVEFLRHNFGSRISELYGVHPWHWYISQGIPFLLLGYLPLVFLGWKSTPWKVRVLLLVNILVFSNIPHKEFRFLGFLLPLFHVVAALGYLSPKCPKILKSVSLIVNTVVALYFSSFHQRGVVSVVDFIRTHAEVKDVSFLMPCHSTPWQAHFQRPLDTDFEPQFLTCEPPWNVSSVGYVDEADQFYSGVIRFIREHPEKLTNTVVAFEPLGALLREMGYRITERFYNGLFNEDSRRQGDVLLLTKIKT